MKIVKLPNGKPEIYSAIQGEGKTIGKPTIFVRLAGCTLRCNFCDTSYSWSKRVVDLSVSKVKELIKKEAGDNIKSITFTGGEPMLQIKDILSIIFSLSYDWFIEIETNGTIPLTENEIKCFDMINCSPKLESSGNRKELRENEKSIKSIIKRGVDNFIFKFVITDKNEQEDLKEVLEFIIKYKVLPTNIYLMPEGVKRDKIIKNSLRLAKICQKYGFNLSTRLQVILYGKKLAV